jgi:putative ABC transport system ATP-binding protein
MHMATRTEERPAAGTETASRAVDVVKIYGSGGTAVTALNHVNVEFAAHRFTAIMGPSGSGKSTLLHCLAGLDNVTSGEVFIGDTNVTALDEKHRTLIRRDKVGFIFQSFNLVPTLTAEENVLLPMALARRDPDREWVNKLTETIGLTDRLHHLPTELSGGEQQRVATARALASRPEIVFADEPTGNLDSQRGAEILSFMQRAVREFGQSIVMVTHDPVAATYAERVVFLQDGVIVDEMAGPTVEKVLDKIKSLET